MPRKKPARRRHFFVRVLIPGALLFAMVLAGRWAWNYAMELLYPMRYQDSVRRWAAVYEMDPLLLNAFICTESGFDPAAESDAGARGLTQITEETFLWLKGKIADDEPLTFADLYDPDTSIRFGAYYISLCLARYNGDPATAAAAYHSGLSAVDRLLQDGGCSADGRTLQTFPYPQMNHYVQKILQNYRVYSRLYPEGRGDTTASRPAFLEPVAHLVLAFFR